MLLEYRCTSIVSLQAFSSKLLYSRLLRTKKLLALQYKKKKYVVPKENNCKSPNV